MMRIICRNCYRKTKLVFVTLVFVFLFALMLNRWSSFDSSENLGSLINSPKSKSVDKNWEWSRDKLNQFMQVLDKHHDSDSINDNDDNSKPFLISPKNITSSNRLTFPSLKNYLTFITDEDAAMTPAYIVSQRPDNKKASLIFGVPHIKRSKESYLSVTLHFLVKNLRPEDVDDTLIIVFIAETDINYVTNTSKMIMTQFGEQMDSGLIEIVSPAKSFYPDFEKTFTKKTLGDPIKRVHWRTKQNLDFAYLMMYAYPRGDYYVQLEDDVVSKPGFSGEIKQCIQDLNKNKTDWVAIRFCRLGFIGQTLRTRDLPQLISFLLIFHQDQPSDWLLDDLIQVRACRKDKDVKDCKKQKDLIWRTSPQSLFQHIGYHSSLDGKVQKLKDKFFNAKDFSFFAHKNNPPAKVSTSLTVYKGHTIEKAYLGSDYFWGMEPKSGDNISIVFTDPVVLDSVVFQSGNFEHPNDRVPNGSTLELLPVETLSINNNNNTFTQTKNGFYLIGVFEEGYLRVGSLKVFNSVRELRINFESNSAFWVILSEIHIKSSS